MKQIGILFCFEMKKITGRKSTWITFVALIVFYFVMFLLPYMATYTSKNSSGGESFSETAWEREVRHRKNGLALSGRSLDGELLQEMSRETEALAQQQESMSLKEFQEKSERYAMVDAVITAMIGEKQLDFSGSPSVEKQLTQGRKEYIESMYRHYQLSDNEKEYWQEKEKRVEKPFTVQYVEGFHNIVGMSGVYMSLLLISFMTAVVISKIFAVEHAQRVDQLTLCSRFGRKQLYFAKILAGVVFAFLSGIFLTGMIFGIIFILYGTEGGSAAIQLIAGWYSYPLSFWEVMLIMLGIEFLAIILTAILTMVVSEVFHSSSVAMVMVFAMYVGVRLINIPSACKLLSQIWNFWPINQVFLRNLMDLRLVSVFGVKLTCWQFTPILYVILSTVLVLVGKRCYCNYQVEG